MPHNGLISPVHVWAIPQRIAASWLRCYSGGRGLIPLPTPYLFVNLGSNQLRAAVVLTPPGRLNSQFHLNQMAARLRLSLADSARRLTMS